MMRVSVLLVALVSSAMAFADTVLVPMRDGVKLATDVHVPQEGGPRFPVVLVRTVYGRQDASLKDGFNKAGIALVVQDTRGHGGSEGDKSYFLTDGWGPLQDGQDTVEWLKAQSWCNGKIGTWGSSALGMTSTLLAPGNTNIAAQVIHVAPCDFYDTYIPGGVPQRALSVAYAALMGYEDAAAERSQHPTYDDYWIQFNAKARAKDITAPGFFVGGWFDLYPQGILDGFTSRHYEGGPGANGNQMLIIGPWNHMMERTVGDFTFPQVSTFPWQRLATRFLHHWLLGEENKIMEAPAVHYYVLGDMNEPDAPGNAWALSDTWPPYPIASTPYYLNADGTLTPETPQAESENRTYTFDPTDPCPSLGGYNYVISGGPRDQRPLNNRNDVLVFRSAPLEAPLEIAGPITVTLHVSSDAPDTDFNAKLLDIYPDGREINMGDGIQRVKFRNGFATPDLLPQGKVGELKIRCQSIALVFNKGHQIGVQITSSNYPRCELNPNTGEDRPRYTRDASAAKDGASSLANQRGSELPPGEVPEILAGWTLDPSSVKSAKNTIHMGKAHPSALVLPVRTP